MPYRSELKRPDLKGQFPCSVCGKIFCHSSSLSRHRMQAHFKSYQCMQCNQEISSNETLRSHMMRTHQIARMFMCRCCNWAFPDKTSLHLHTTSLSKTGKPGEVAVLARSFAEGDEPLTPMDLHNTPSSSPPETRDSISPSDIKPPQFEPPTINNIPPVQFPHPVLSNPMYLQAILSQLEMVKRGQERGSMEKSDEIFPFRKTNPWLENNPFLNVPKEQQPLVLATLYKEIQSRKRPRTPEDEPQEKKFASENESTAIAKLNVGDSDSTMEDNVSNVSKNDINERKNKRKSRKPQQLPQSNLLNLSTMDIFNGPLIKTEFDEKKNGESDSEHNQLSPAVSDSHSSGSANEIHESLEMKKDDEKINEYAERLSAISKSIARFIELAQKENLEQEKQLVLDIAFQIREQCHVN